MQIDPKRIKKQIQAEAQLHSRWGAVKTWSFVLREIFRNDIKAAKEFMISEDGGFEKSEIERIIKKRQINQKLYDNKLYSGAEAF